MFCVCLLLFCWIVESGFVLLFQCFVLPYSSIRSLSLFESFYSALSLGKVKQVRGSDILNFKEPNFQFVAFLPASKYSFHVHTGLTLTTTLNSLFSLGGYISTSDISIYSNTKVVTSSPASWCPLIKFDTKHASFSEQAVINTLRQLAADRTIHRLSKL